VPDPVAYVFGYASLVALEDAASLPGRLRGYRRFWGVAMNNWEGGEDTKHWLDRESGERPRIRVAYLDLREEEGSVVNGLALPVDAERLAQLDAREINYERVEVTAAFEPAGSPTPPVDALRVFTYVGLAAARERCQLGADEGNVIISSDYVGTVRRAFERRGSETLAEFDRTTDSLPFPEGDLRVVLPRMLDT
jgi:cation transport regulator ChaC